MSRFTAGTLTNSTKLDYFRTILILCARKIWRLYVVWGKRWKICILPVSLSKPFLPDRILMIFQMLLEMLHTGEGSAFQMHRR